MHACYRLDCPVRFGSCKSCCIDIGAGELAQQFASVLVSFRVGEVRSR